MNVKCDFYIQSRVISPVNVLRALSASCTLKNRTGTESMNSFVKNLDSHLTIAAISLTVGAVASTHYFIACIHRCIIRFHVLVVCCCC